MTTRDESLAQLGLVRDLLLNPTRASMRECERLLADVTSAVSNRLNDSAFLSEVRTSLQPVRFLLGKAAIFWAARQRTTQAPQTYTPDGRLLVPASAGSISVEV